MAKRVLSDDEVFGSPSPGGKRTLSDADVFGNTEQLEGGWAPRVAREGMPVNRKEAMKEQIRAERANGSNPIVNTLNTASNRLGTGWRSAVGSIPFGDDMVAGLATVAPSDFDYSLPAAERFARNRDYVEAQHAVDWEKEPVSTAVGTVGGLLAGPGAKYIAEAPGVASTAWRSGLVGAGYGAADGLGSNGTAEQRAERGVRGAAMGAGFGAGAPLVARGAGALGAEMLEPIVGRYQQWRNPQGYVDRLTASALNADERAGRVISDADLAAARRASSPLVLGDMGGDATQALARTAANANPAARGIMENVVDPRYEGQSGRLSQMIGNLFDIPSPAALRARIDEAERLVNRRAYKELYGNYRILYNENLMNLLDVPEVARAAETVLGRNPGMRAAGMSSGPMSRDIPNIEFWDRIQRELRDRARGASGERAQEAAALYNGLRQQIVGEVDRLTGGRYSDVRHGAAQFFGAENALEAGQNFFRQNNLNQLEAARDAISRFSEAERRLFAQGFAAEMAHASGNTAASRNIPIQSWLSAPNAQEKMRLALGEGRANDILSVTNVESGMNRLRTAIKGNSTTLRQMLESGLFGGGIGVILEQSMDPYQAFTNPAGLVFGAARALASRHKGMSPAIAERLARQLMSNDPAVLDRMMRQAARDGGRRSFLRELESVITRGGSQELSEKVQGYADGGMVTEPKTGAQYYGQEEMDRRELEALSPGGPREVAAPATTYPGDELQERYKNALPMGIRVPRNAVKIVERDDGAFPVDAEGRQLAWVRQRDMIPMATDETGSYLAMPPLPELMSNIAGGGTEGAGMMVASGFRIPGKAGRAVRAAEEAAPAARAAEEIAPAARAAEEAGLPAPKMEPLEEAAARVERASPVPEAPDAPLPAARDTGADFHMEVERGQKGTGRVRLSPEEQAQVEKLAEDAGVDPAIAVDMWREERAKYPTKDFAPIEPAKIDVAKDGSFEIVPREIPYAFNRPKGVERADAEPDPALAQRIAKKLADEVFDVAGRAEQGDRNAQVIMRARNWYKSMRDRLRAEFGSFADVFADVLGTTSAQTAVRQNWDNAVEALSNFTEGKYDTALTKLDDWYKSGGVIGNAKTEEGKGYLPNGWVNNHERTKKEALPGAREQAAAEGLSGKAAEARAKDLAFAAAQEQFPLITKSDGRTLFNANSPSTMEAFLDLFRQVKPGSAPKTPNFTGNLIGYSQKATIDVWAARLLRRLAGMKAIPNPAEAGVGGSHLADVSKVGGEFGFGQEVFKRAAEMLRKDERFKDLGDDDLQAIVWFLEKENWTKKGWTNKAGEGGSLEYEANLAGIPDRQWVSDQRRLMNTDPTGKQRKELATTLADTGPLDAAKQRLQEIGWTIQPFSNGASPTAAMVRDRIMAQQGITDAKEAFAMAKAMQAEAKEAKRLVDGYSAKGQKLDTLTRDYEATKANATRALDEAASPVRRLIGGLSPNRSDYPATDVLFATGSERLASILKNDPSVLASKATPTKGRYIDPSGGVWDERAYDLEVVTRQNFDPMPLWKQMVREAKRRNQDSVFLSEVVPPGTLETANPGVEIYFRKKVDEATADAITKRINQLGVDAGFTYAVDVRQADRAAQKAGKAPTEFVGIRVQYIPEFGGGIEGAKQARTRMYDLINELTNVPGVSNARMVEYDTQVAFGGDYDAILAGNVSGGRQAQWAGQPGGKGDPRPALGGGVPAGDVGPEVVRRRRGGPAAPQGREGRKAPVEVHDLDSFIQATAPRSPGRFAMGGPVLPAAVEPRQTALTRRGALSMIHDRRS